MKTKTRAGCHTFEDFCSLVQDGQKADLIDGVIYMASPDSTEADDLFGWLFFLLYGYVAKKKLGRVFGSRVAFRLDDRHSPEPDLSFLRSECADRIEPGRVEGPPDLAIEIVSPESVERDYKIKRKQYQRAGVSEYWIIDPDKQKVLLLRRNARGRYQEVVPHRGKLYSKALPGFWIDPDWLWHDRPDVLAVLQQLLAE
jgi:Uma2 family endonuclease